MHVDEISHVGFIDLVFEYSDLGIQDQVFSQDFFHFPFDLDSVHLCLYTLNRIVLTHTLKTGIPFEEGDSLLKLPRRVSLPEVQGPVRLSGGILVKKPPLLLSTVMEFTFQVIRSKLLTFLLRKLSTSPFILNFSECSPEVPLNVFSHHTSCPTKLQVE